MSRVLTLLAFFLFFSPALGADVCGLGLPKSCVADDSGQLTANPVLGQGAGVQGSSITMYGSVSGPVKLIPSASSSSWTLTLPPNAGVANQFTITDGLGNTTWSPLSIQSSNTIVKFSINGTDILDYNVTSANAWNSIAPFVTQSGTSFAIGATNDRIMGSASGTTMYLGSPLNNSFLVLDTSPNPTSGNVYLQNVLGWQSSASNQGTNNDTGLSRISAGVIGLGNGTAGNTSGTLRLSGLTCTNCITLPDIVTIPNNTVLGNNSGGTASPSASSVVNAQLANMPADTKKCNSTTSSAIPTDCQLEFIHSKDYGAIGNNVHDDTTNLQNWLNDIQSTHICGFLDSGIYKISSALSISQSTANNICIKGAGFYNSTIASNSTTADSLDITSTFGSNGGGPILEDFGIQPSVTPVSGNLLSLTGSASGTGMLQARLRGVFLAGGFNNLLMTNLTQVSISDSYISGCINTCATLNNTGFVGSGDFGFGNTTFIPNTGSIAGILVSAGSGLRLTGGKILGAGTTIGVLFSPNTAGAYSDVQLTGMSIENQGGSAIKFSKGSATTLMNVSIYSNEFSVSGIGANVIDLSDASAQWLSGVTITGNTIDMLSNNMVGINIGQSTKGFSIAGSVFRSSLAATGLTGVNISSTAGNGNISCDNEYDGVTTPVSNANGLVTGCISLNGHSGYVGKSSTVSACGTSPVGPTGTDIAGTVTTGSTATTSCLITFTGGSPIGYKTAPICICSNAGGGTACASAVSTTTTLTLGYASATSQTYNWHCVGF